uniref:DUF3794 domain-containing protein n=1 Tax=Parastrongyloides trichosuri TaxID=131310 RepID=A0A0N5A7H9_PARTI
MVVTGNVSCNGTLYNGSTITIKECETANIICNKNVSNVPLIGNTFNHSVKLSNERKVEFSLIIEIQHKCCDSPFKTITYKSQLIKNLQSDNFKCGSSLQNVKNYGTIELPIKSNCYCEEYRVYLRGDIYCRKSWYFGVTIDIYLCDLSRIICTKISHIRKVGITFYYIGYLSNERKSDSILRIDINHKCCGQRRGVNFYANTKILYPFESYLKCGKEWNIKIYDKIDLSETYCSSRDFNGPFGKK